MLTTKGIRTLERRTRSTLLLLLIFLAGLILGQPAFHTHDLLTGLSPSHSGLPSLAAGGETAAYHLPVCLVCVSEKVPALHSVSVSPGYYFPLEDQNVYSFFCPKFAGEAVQPLNRAPPARLTYHNHIDIRPLPV